MTESYGWHSRQTVLEVAAAEAGLGVVEDAAAVAATVVDGVTAGSVGVFVGAWLAVMAGADGGVADGVVAAAWGATAVAVADGAVETVAGGGTVGVVLGIGVGAEAQPLRLSARAKTNAVMTRIRNCSFISFLSSMLSEK